MREILNDYRCDCGKLLLKGFIFVGEVEIRCRFCKRTITINGLNGNLSSNDKYVLVSDNTGKILKTTTSAIHILGYSHEELKQLNVHNILTGLSDASYSKIWDLLQSNISKSILFKGEETQKNREKRTVQIGVRTLTSQLDKQTIFIFDINLKVPQTLKKMTFKNTKGH